MDFSELINADSVALLMGLINKLAGPMAEETGALFGDKVRDYRMRNCINTFIKTERLLREAGIEVKAVPPRLFLPILEGCSVEDSEQLQDMWAGLLASASQQTDELSPSFIETLKQLTPQEAKQLQQAHDAGPTALMLREPSGPSRNSMETYLRLGLVARDYGLTNEAEPAVGYLCMFTKYEAAFMRACQGRPPKKDGSKGPLGV
jgi:hypothetical protein